MSTKSPDSAMKVVGLSFVCVLSVTAQSRDDGAIDDAIKLGLGGRTSELLSECVAASSGPSMRDMFKTGPIPHGSYRVHLGTNLGRIAFFAAEAKTKYMPYSKADVPEDLLKSAVHVWIDPNEPTKFQKNLLWASPIKHVVLKSKEKPDAVVQPEKLETVPVEWENLAGKFTGNRATLIFPLDAVKALPTGDFDVVLITEAGERRCKVGQKDRRKLNL